MLLHLSTVVPFLLPRSILYGYTYHSLSLTSWGTSGHFWFEVIRNKVAMNTRWQVSVWTYAFLSTGWIFRRGLAGSWAGYVFTFLRNCAAVFQSGCTVLCLRCKGFPASPTQFSDALCSRPSSLSAVHLSLVTKQNARAALSSQETQACPSILSPLGFSCVLLPRSRARKPC